MPKRKMSTVSVRAFIGEVKQLLESDQRNEARQLFHSGNALMEFYAQGHPDLLGELKDLNEKMMEASSPPTPPNVWLLFEHALQSDNASEAKNLLPTLDPTVHFRAEELMRDKALENLEQIRSQVDDLLRNKKCHELQSILTSVSKWNEAVARLEIAKCEKAPDPPAPYELLVRWARDMESAGRWEYALRFLKMARTIKDLTTSDILLESELEQRIEQLNADEDIHDVTVLVVGQPSSGKSVMLGALWRFLNSHGELAEVSIQGCSHDSIREFYDRIMDDKMEVGIFPPGTPPKFREPISEFVIDIRPRPTVRGWFGLKKELPKARIRLVDIAGEQFNEMGDINSREVDPFVTNFLFTPLKKVIIFFVIDKDVVTRRQEHKVDRYFTLVNGFLQRKGVRPGDMGDRVGLVFTKWDKNVVGVSDDPMEFMDRFPSARNIFPQRTDHRIFTFSVGQETTSTERQELNCDFKWDPAKPQILARRLYRSATGVNDDPWIALNQRPKKN